jgi:hypothetical protein
VAIRDRRWMIERLASPRVSVRLSPSDQSPIRGAGRQTGRLSRPDEWYWYASDRHACKQPLRLRPVLCQGLIRSPLRIPAPQCGMIAGPSVDLPAILHTSDSASGSHRFEQSVHLGSRDRAWEYVPRTGRPGSREGGRPRARFGRSRLDLVIDLIQRMFDPVMQSSKAWPAKNGITIGHQGHAKPDPIQRSRHDPGGPRRSMPAEHRLPV